MAWRHETSRQMYSWFDNCALRVSKLSQKSAVLDYFVAEARNHAHTWLLSAFAANGKNGRFVSPCQSIQEKMSLAERTVTELIQENLTTVKIPVLWLWRVAA
jgi:hypothetical protein